MTKDQIKRAALLTELLDGLPDIRAGLKKKPSQRMNFELGAFDGDDDGGVGRGSVLTTPSVGAEILDLIEPWARAELEKLGVTE